MILLFILNEKEYVEHCLEFGIVDKNPYQVISLLSKYYYHDCEYKKKQITELLISYLKKYYPRYELNETQWLDAIEKLVTNSAKEKLHNISGVKITKREIETIRGIKNKTLERLMFTSLCIAKFNNLKNVGNNNWVNSDTSEVFKLARISCTLFGQDVKLNELYERGLIDFPKKNGNLNYRVTFVDNDGDEEIFISDFRELGYEYLNYIGESFIRCADCGVLTRTGKTNRKKYCEKHGSERVRDFEKTIYCVDCGRPTEVSSKNNRTKRCPECYELYRRERKTETQRSRREFCAMKSEQN